MRLNALLINQDVTYYRQKDKPFKTINSLLTLERDAEGKVVRHTEEWDHKHEPTSDNGFLGVLSEGRKKLTAAITGAFVSQDPDKATGAKA